MIVLSEDTFRHAAKAVAHYQKGCDRIKDTILIIADHIRASRRHVCDSLGAGQSANWRADDALLEELVVQVLVALEISCSDHKHDVKYRLVEAAENEAAKAVLEEFESNKHELVMSAQHEYLEFLQWKREKKEVKPSKKSK